MIGDPSLFDIGLLTSAEAAEAAGVTPATIRSWVRRYSLTQTVVDGVTYLAEREVLDCERDRRRSGRRRYTTRPKEIS